MLVLSGSPRVKEKRESREAALAKKQAKAAAKDGRPNGERQKSRFGRRRTGTDGSDLARARSRASTVASGSSTPRVAPEDAEAVPEAVEAANAVETVVTVEDTSTPTGEPQGERSTPRPATASEAPSDLPNSPGPAPDYSEEHPAPPSELSPPTAVEDAASSRAATSAPTSRRSSVVPPMPEQDPDRVFLQPIPTEGVDVTSFKSLGAAGWDLWGPRDATVLDGSQKRGDCCTGTQISCSTNVRFSLSAADWSMYYGSYGYATQNPAGTGAVPVAAPATVPTAAAATPTATGAAETAST